MSTELFNASEYLLDRRVAAGDGDRLALTGPGGDLSYSQLLDSVRRTSIGPASSSVCVRSSGC